MKKRWLFLLFLLISTHIYAENLPQHNRDYCKPKQACWPTEKDWHILNENVGGRLMKVISPIAACKNDSNSSVCKQELEKAKNPFYLESQPGATQISGWLKAWQYAPSVFTVAAENSKDISQAVLFAKKHHLKLVIKGTGHDYLGRSSAPDSLLIWTHNMHNISIDDTLCVAKTSALVMLSGMQQYVFPNIKGLSPDQTKA